MKKSLRFVIFTILTIIILSLVANSAGSASKLQINQNDSFSMFTESGEAPINFGKKPPFMDKKGNVFIPVSHVKKVFQGGINCTVDKDVVTITQKGFEYITTLKVKVGSNKIYVNDKLIETDSKPVYKNDIIYIPIENIAKALEHYVYRYLDDVIVTYDCIEIYMWNVNEKSSVSGLRYTIMQGTLREKELSEIYSRSVSNFGLIEKQFGNVPDGDISLTALYKIKGYKVPYENFENIEHKIINRFGYRCGYSGRLIDDIQPIIQGTGKYTDAWFSEQLTALGEDGLRNNKGHVYRFTHIPSFDNPRSMRIEIMPTGAGVLTYSECNGSVDFSGGEVIKKTKKNLSKKQVDELLRLISKHDYWNLPTTGGDDGLDGSEWIIEGVKDGKYHIVNRWEPEKDAVYNLGMYFLNISGEYNAR